MPLDASALGRGCRNFDIATGRQFCRAELDRFRARAGSGAPLTVGCTQEAALFREVTEDSGADIRFVNLRESAGWSTDAAKAGPKMAALAAAGAQPMPGIPFVQLESAGVVLVYGRAERAIEAARLLNAPLHLTLLFTRPAPL